MKTLSLSEISVEMGKRRILDKLSFTINSGEIFGLIGMNGSGKTTTLKVICGLIKPKSGSILLDMRQADTGNSDFKKIIGYCPQENSFFDKLTVAENLRYFACLYDVKSSIENLTRSISSSLGIDDRLEDCAFRLSGGMKRRLNIACALMHEPKILLMDEPSVELDPVSRSDLWKTIKQINRSGTTIIISSNLIEDIRFLCDRALLLENGRKMLEGPTEEIIYQISAEGFGSERC